MNAARRRHMNRSKSVATLERTETELCVRAYGDDSKLASEEHALAVNGVRPHRRRCKTGFRKSVVSHVLRRLEVFYFLELGIAAERIVADRDFTAGRENDALELIARSKPRRSDRNRHIRIRRVRGAFRG